MSDYDPIADIFEAVEASDLLLVQELLASSSRLAGAWRRTEHGGWESALHVAANHGSLDISRLLVEAGADLYPLRQGDYPPFFWAKVRGHEAVAEFLLAASAASDHCLPPTYGCGIDLVLAARLGMLDRVMMHLAKDPLAVFRRGCIGETVLHWPAHNGSVEIVKALIDAGAVVDADEICLYGGKPLHWAAEHAPECVQLLLSHGADPDSRNLLPKSFEGYTPLHMCARQPEECIECIDLLIAVGADIHATDAQGQTPSDVAALNGRTRMQQHLASRM